jgi:hypothetical protein
LGAELLLALRRCLRLAAIELGCLSRRAFVGELALERRAVFACALFGPVGALAGGLGALLDAIELADWLIGAQAASGNIVPPRQTAASPS